MKKILTLVFFKDDEKILLGYKKRGFGAHRWNGFGGKVQENEDVLQTAKREAFEECGLEIEELEKRAVHEFRFLGQKEMLEVHTFLVTKWKGVELESEEMRPQWFLLSEIPYSEMWPDDIYWIPLFLKGKFLRTKFLFGENDKVLEHHIQEVSAENL